MRPQARSLRAFASTNRGLSSPSAGKTLSAVDIRRPSRRRDQRSYEAIERLAGGRAAVFHSGTIAFAWTIPSRNPRETIKPRFDALASTLLAAFQALGADARIGEVPGEYCPGAYSINVSGRHKIMGTGQRIIGRAAHVGGVIVVEGGDRIAEVLLPVYRALELPWDPTTSGDLAGAVPGITRQDVMAAVVSEFDHRYGLEPGTIDAATLEQALGLETATSRPTGRSFPDVTGELKDDLVVRTRPWPSPRKPRRTVQSRRTP